MSESISLALTSFWYLGLLTNALITSTLVMKFGPELMMNNPNHTALR